MAADNFLQLDSLIFWEIGVIFLTITPIGFIFSAKFIYFGENTFKRLDSQLWIVITIIFMILVMILYPIQRPETENIMIWDTLAAIMILGAVFEYYRIYLMKPTWNNKVALIITGLITSVSGIFANFIIILTTNESSPIFRHLFVIIGIFIVIIAYNFIPETRKIKDWLELSILNKEMELIIDIITHDLTNQLVSTQSYLTLHSKDNNPKYLLKSITGINNAQNLVKNVSILMKSKIESKNKLTKKPLLKEIKKAIEELKTLFPNKTIEIKVININNTHTVSADSLFSHLLINLLTNAVKSYNKEETNIKIELKREPLLSQTQKFNLLIIDHGKGIAPEQRLEIFERYSEFRKDGTGSGLGLFIVHTLMQRYKGKIKILSTNPLDFTKGTTIELEFST